jgi:hypothetical protein
MLVAPLFSFTLWHSRSRTFDLVVVSEVVTASLVAHIRSKHVFALHDTPLWQVLEHVADAAAMLSQVGVSSRVLPFICARFSIALAVAFTRSPVALQCLDLVAANGSIFVSSINKTATSYALYATPSPPPTPSFVSLLSFPHFVMSGLASAVASLFVWNGTCALVVLTVFLSIVFVTMNGSAILAAEKLLRIVPEGTHEWSKYKRGLHVYLFPLTFIIATGSSPRPQLRMFFCQKVE